jgi:hypothetical protein
MAFTGLDIKIQTCSADKGGSYDIYQQSPKKSRRKVMEGVCIC